MRPAVALVSGFGNGVVLGHQPARPRFHYPNASIFLLAAGTAPPTHVVRAEAAAQLFLAPSVIRSCYFTPIVSQRWAEPQSKLEVPSCMFLVVSALLIHRCVSFVLIVLLSLLYTPMFLVLSHFSFRSCHYSTRP